MSSRADEKARRARFATAWTHVNLLRTARWAQLATSVGVIGLFWVVYPGIMALFATLAGLLYLAFAIAAALGYRLSGYVAFAFSCLTAALTTPAVLQFFNNGFDFLSGNWGQQGGVFFAPYLFLVLSAASVYVVAAHLVVWLSGIGHGRAG